MTYPAEGFKKAMGLKDRKNKPRVSLLPFCSLVSIAEVLSWAVENKYPAHNWKLNEPEVYEDALLRHLFAHFQGEKNDNETGLTHLAHAGACLLFLLWFSNRDEGEDQ